MQHLDGGDLFLWFCFSSTHPSTYLAPLGAAGRILCMGRRWLDSLFSFSFLLEEAHPIDEDQHRLSFLAACTACNVEQFVVEAHVVVELVCGLNPNLE